MDSRLIIAKRHAVKLLKVANEIEALANVEEDIVYVLRDFLSRVINGEFISTYNWIRLNNFTNEICEKNSHGSHDLQINEVQNLFHNVYMNVMIPLAMVKENLCTAQAKETEELNRQQKFRKNLERLHKIKEKTQSICKSKSLPNLIKTDDNHL